jgi:hypothetical protein
MTGLARDIEVDRKVLEHLAVDYDAHVREVAELKTRLETLKQQGLQLLKQLRAGRKAVDVQGQIISRLQERIAAAERQFTGAAVTGAEPSVEGAAPLPNGCDALERAVRDRLAALPSVAAPSPPADRPDSTAAEAGDFIEGSPLIAQLLEYQFRQTRLGRPRRMLLSLALFAIIVASLLGFGLLLSEMLGFDTLQLTRPEVASDRADRGVSGAAP